MLERKKGRVMKEYNSPKGIENRMSLQKYRTM